jgi:hypothetical protein
MRNLPPYPSPKPPKSGGSLEFLVDELTHKDLYVMIFASALMSLAYMLRSGARDGIYWRLHE